MKRYVHEQQLNSSYTDIEGMALVGDISLKGRTLEIYVNTNDAGKIPHFHIRDKQEWDKFHSCIRIDAPEYFLHGTKTDKLNSQQRKALQEFMTSSSTKKLFNEDGSRMNNWQRICILWDENNSDVEIPENTIQPDYTLLR